MRIQRRVDWRGDDGVFADEVVSIVPMVPIVLEQTQVLRALEDELVTEVLGLTLIHVRQRSLGSVEGHVELIREELRCLDARD